MRKSKHRAVSRYKHGGKFRGKTISQSEIQRRIAQSFGFKHSLPQPDLMDQPDQTTVFTDEAVETKTLQL